MGTQIGGLMRLLPQARQVGAQACWVAYVAADDVDAAASQLQHLGGKVHDAPANIPGVTIFAAVADPQGAVFHLFRAAPSREPAVSSAAGHLGWRARHTTDWSRALAFYGAMFGWGKDSGFERGALGPYRQFTIGGTSAGRHVQ